MFRTTDPPTSREAAEAVASANEDLIAVIRWAVDRYGPLTQEQIAFHVGRRHKDRWLPGTVVTACARAKLIQVGTTVNARGRGVALWARGND